MRSTTCIIHILPDYAMLPFTKACHDKQAIRCHSIPVGSLQLGRGRECAVGLYGVLSDPSTNPRSCFCAAGNVWSKLSQRTKG